MYGIGHGWEIIVVLVIALVVFGGKKLPDLGKGLGEGIKEFRKATTGEGEKDAASDAVSAASTTTPPAAEAPKSSTDTVTDSPAAKPPASAQTPPVAKS